MFRITPTEANVFTSIGRFAARRRWQVVAASIAFLVLGGVWGAAVFGNLIGGAGFDDPASESARADVAVEGPLGRLVTDVVVLYRSPTATVDDPAFAGPVQAALAAVPTHDLARVDSYWSTGSPDYVSADRHATYVGLQFHSTDPNQRVADLREIKSAFEVPGLTVQFGGVTAMTDQVNQLTSRDLGRAELFSIPILLVILVLIFRSVVAAMFPLAVGVVVALGAFVLLRVVTMFVEISTFAISPITIFGLGLAIDYSLFMVYRFREELGRGVDPETAVVRSVATAGRTVAFSGLTVAVCLLALTVFPSRFLQSMGYAGAITVLFAVVTSLFLLPALLRIVGHRVDRLRIPAPVMFGRRRSGRRSGAVGELSTGRWYRTAQAVMRRPVLTTVGVVVVLVALGAPLLGVNWARPAEWVLPAQADARAVTAQMDTDFPANPSKVMTVVVEQQGPGSPDPQALDEYAGRLATVDGVTGASVTATVGAQSRISLAYTPDPMGREAVDMVHDLRAQPAPAGTTTLLTGMPASRVDIVDMVISRLPWMALFVAIVSFTVMFLAFGSVVLAAKAIVLNLLSLGAAFGAIRLIFQDGWLSGLLGFVPVGAVDINFPVLIVAVAFGLAVDYEVFLVSRIREHWVQTGNLTESVAVGLQRTGTIITSAALALMAVVSGFLFSEITFMKMLGVGLIIAVVVDATVVRGLLVPATMRLLGDYAWWSPRPMAQWWQRHLRPEGADEPAITPSGSAPAPVGR